MVSNDSSFTYTNQFEIPASGPQRCYLVSISEWGYLKKRIKDIDLKLNPYFSIGFWFLGIAATLLYNALLGSVLDVSKHTICLVAGFAFLLLGFSFIWFGFKHGAHQKNKSDDITEHMELIEERFKANPPCAE